MSGELLYGKSELFIFLGLSFLAYPGGGGRFLAGAQKAAQLRGGSETSVFHHSSQGSVLGLLALLLAFTFGMAQSRFELRQREVLDESNAIGTAYLRSRLLSQPYQTDAANLLRRYVDSRLEFYEARTDPAMISATTPRRSNCNGISGPRLSPRRRKTPVR